MVRASDARFYPGLGEATFDYLELLRAGAVVGRTGRVLVRADGPAAFLDVPGVVSVRELPGGIFVLQPGHHIDDLALSRSLHGMAGVVWATPDVVLPLAPFGIPDDPWLVEQWHLDNTGQGGRTVDVDINAPQAWEYATGAGITIAVLDSGVQLDHPDLSVIAGGDYVDHDADPSPSTDSSAPHGTGVAGIAAAVGNNGLGVAGVAYDAEVFAIRLIGGESSLTDLYESFVEAVDNGASVLSNSWGYSGGCQAYPEYETFREMYNYAEENGRAGLGSVVVFAAGNDGCDIEDDGLLATKKLLVVAALESDDERASYSNYGKWVDIAAPTNLLTTDMTPGGYGSYGGDEGFYDGFSGTSGATPVVSGVIALMFEANPRLTADQVRDVVCQTATRNDGQLADYDADGWSPYYGCGRIDAGAAVAAVANTAPGVAVAAEFTELPAAGAVLSWQAAADVDADVLGYRVRWQLGDDAHTDDVYGLSHSLVGQVKGGDSVVWTVSAFDTWGEGALGAESFLQVLGDDELSDDIRVFTPDESEFRGISRMSVCASGGGSAGGGLGIAGLIVCSFRRCSRLRFR